MTTIITRLYKDLATAQGVASDLTSAGHLAGNIAVISRDGAGTDEARMLEARVPKASVAAYAPGIAKGAALLVVRAPFAPIGTARHVLAHTHTSTRGFECETRRTYQCAADACCRG